MVRYGSKEVLQILAVRPHVLRYWEQLLPLVRAERDETGHRVWTEAQVRILQRLAHLVNDRGMAVQAAGDAILQEAESGAGNVKGILEAVRHELMTVLHSLRRNEEIARKRSGPLSSTAVDAGVRRFDGTRRDMHLSSSGEWNPVEHGGVPRPEEMERRGADRQRHLERRNRISPLKTIDRSNSDVVRIAYRHLFAYTSGSRGDTRDIPYILGEILRHRFASETGKGPGITVVCAPVGEVDRYRSVFAGLSGPAATVLPVPYLSFDGARWVSPLLSVLIALRDAPVWGEFAGREIASREVAGRERSRWGYLWAPENPDVPMTLPIPDLEFPSASPVLTGHPMPRGTLLGEALAIPLGNRALLDNLIRSGRWSPGRVLDCNGKDADTFPVRWRYDLMLRDLIVRDTRWIALPRSDRPSLWRGDEWRRQMPAVWPELDLRKGQETT
jgi:DNA-binding transcriptional MerR regulator